MLTDLSPDTGHQRTFRPIMARNLRRVLFAHDSVDRREDIYIKARLTLGERHSESYSGKLREELLNGEIFHTTHHA